jgi:hypothetical protein|eukprot:CAMPEP_0174347420 /NCGR_PEP_ID=MMETSP0811_2-20130205/3493_1 /TAXON_ID=73025 ORGANISM="Eutreptiella gymnastica-like, Strain CCMP1594" /NCGR_SAMPLE_ID=MMETSP0811_2 /ASSEMBLY_ACC=CAM_ASM_000667 /LENGTH=220 /DNA_ID=CAMNT_0015472951 /DNA_START=16 /DNA_END=678 /DNA_ORIENTATION=-
MAQQAKLLDVFRRIDKDKNGFISRQEYVEALKILNIPRDMALIVADSVFEKYDTDGNKGIDEQEFVKYFGDHAALEQRIEREWFASTYSLVVSIFFMLMGVRFMSDPFGATYEVFPTLPVDSCKDWQTASVHMFFVVGFCTFTFGFLMLAQRVLRLSVTSTLTMFTAIWCVYTEFERHLGSPVRAKGFKAPPVGVTAVTGMMALVGLYAAFKGNAKIKED